MKEKNKIIVFIVVVVVLLGGLFTFAKPGKIEIKEINVNSDVPSSTLTLEVLETFHDFGVISMKNGDVSKVFAISNPTDQDINLEKLFTSCMCTVAYFIQSDGSKKGPFGMPGMGIVPKLNKTIKAGETASIEVVYDPNAHGPAGVGMIERSVFLEDENNKVVEFKFKANVTP
jgi:hypothetical protein